MPDPGKCQHRPGSSAAAVVAALVALQNIDLVIIKFDVIGNCTDKIGRSGDLDCCRRPFAARPYARLRKLKHHYANCLS